MSPTVQRKLCERLAAETQEREPSPCAILPDGRVIPAPLLTGQDGKLRRMVAREPAFS